MAQHGTACAWTRLAVMVAFFTTCGVGDVAMSGAGMVMGAAVVVVGTDLVMHLHGGDDRIVEARHRAGAESERRAGR